MPTETVFRNARIVTADEVVAGALVLRDGLIAGIDTGRVAAGEDMEGDYLLPGLVELHTDHLEGHYAPRPKVRWNPVAAVLAHDAQVATAGITTVFDALRVGLEDDDAMRPQDMRRLADAVNEASAGDLLRADHFLHLRCEVSASNCMEAFSFFDDDARVRMVSLMDHAPGQRQFARIEAYAMYYKDKFRMSEPEFEAFCARRIARSQKHSAPNRAAVSAACRARGIVLASHDDATEAHVAEAVADGIAVAEFPTTIAAAAASHEAGMSVLMGAPNLVRGGSHSGNVSTRELAENGTLDILSSDYIPFSLMQAAFALGGMVGEISLPKAVAMVSRNPARAVGLCDRGEIAAGLRADLVRVRVAGDLPLVRSVWRKGRRVA